jgi:predicted DNA binding CopG/RHH family protein
MDSMSEKITFRLNKNLFHALKQTAIYENMKPAEFIRTAVSDVIEVLAENKPIKYTQKKEN